MRFQCAAARPQMGVALIVHGSVPSRGGKGRENVVHERLRRVVDLRYEILYGSVRTLTVSVAAIFLYLQFIAPCRSSARGRGMQQEYRPPSIVILSVLDLLAAATALIFAILSFSVGYGRMFPGVPAGPMFDAGTFFVYGIAYSIFAVC